MGADGSQGPGQGNGSAQGNRVVVEPGAVPALRDAFADALAKVDRQLELAEAGLQVMPWANDPVSSDATNAFNARSMDAAEFLRAYRDRLSTAVATLDRTAEQYQVADEDNSATVSKQEGTGA